MSAGYAERLSEYPNKGKCGLPESHDTPRALASKLDTLAKLMRQSTHTVVLTGAGCSTSAGIPDFRGPNGIWTREMKEKKRTKRRKGGGAKKRKSGELAGGDTGDRSVGPTWVQCDLCDKWRRIPASVASDLPVKWNCSMNTLDKMHSKCSAPEEDYNHNHGGAIKAGFTPTADLTTRTIAQMNECITLVPSSKAVSNDPIPRQQNVSETGVSNDDKSAIPSFASVIPTYTHRALTHLILHPPSKSYDETTHRTYLNYIVTQNIDGLHRKACLPRKHLSILHGDIFTEVCDTCHMEHVRSYEIASIGLSYTGRKCTLGGIPPGSCEGKLIDTLLDWENDLPEKDWTRAQEECEKADLIVCMGTSLRIEPAGGLCMFAKDADASNKKKGRKLGYVIVNLQVTPYDDDASLIIRGKVDDVMEGLMRRLGYSHDWDELNDYGKST